MVSFQFYSFDCGRLLIFGLFFVVFNRVQSTMDSGLIDEFSFNVVMSKIFRQDFDHHHEINIKAFNLLDIIEFEEFSFILDDWITIIEKKTNEIY